MKTFSKIFILFFVAYLSSCNSYQSLVNFNDYPRLPDGPQPITNFKPLKVQPSDILKIRVSSTNATAVAAFNMSGSEEGGGGFDEFLVNSKGEIDFPTVGKILVEGLEIEEVKDRVLERLMPFFEQPPIVQVRLTNFRVNVNGEVAAPGSFNVYNDRLTVLEAISLAGDFTSYSQRDSVLIIREQGGVRNFGYVNFYSSDIFSSPYFYLQQNDVVYVRPNKNKVTTVRDPATRVLPWVSAGVSVLLLVFTVSRN